MGPRRCERCRVRPRLLDLFCGAGGAARGYQMAGFHVTGVDIKPQPNYAGDVFVQADALEYVAAHGHEFDAIHASPPCHAYSTVTGRNRRNTKRYPDLIPPTRELLLVCGSPWIMENVEGAPIKSPVRLCGSSFGLDVRRHRLFETSFPVAMVPPCAHHWQKPRFRSLDSRMAGRLATVWRFR